MKFAKTIFVGLSALVLPAMGATLPVLESRIVCGNVSNAWYYSRFYNPTTHDHALTTDIWQQISWTLATPAYQADGDPNVQGWTNAIGSFFYGAAPEPGTFPLYSLYNSATITHFYTTSAEEAIAALDANPPFVYDLSSSVYQDRITGYVYVDGSCPGTVPLYRLYNAAYTDYYYTTLQTSVDTYVANGYVQQGIAAYVYSLTTVI